MQEIEGYLLDAWVTSPQVNLWIKGKDGKNYFFTDTYYPEIYAYPKTKRGERLFTQKIQKGVFFQEILDPKKEVWSGQSLPVYSVRVAGDSHLRKLRQQADRLEDDLELFNVDFMDIHQYFLYKNLYPFAEVKVRMLSKSQIRVTTLGERENFYKQEIPHLNHIHLKTAYGKFVLLKNNPIIVEIPQEEPTYLYGKPELILKELNDILNKQDPDIIFSYEGDEHIFPGLFYWSRKYQIPIYLDRHQQVYIRKTKIRKTSYTSYGKVIAKTTPFPLYGRIHIDLSHSFYYLQSNLQGIYEMCRHSRLPIQKLSRSSPGNAMSAMENEKAMDMGYLVPRTKGQPPDIKPLRDILKCDQGGMSFRPPIGVFADVIELDFRSLYPNLMRLYNVSGETINCSCCKDGGKKIPETPYHTCGKRQGIITRAISILLDRKEQLLQELQDTELTPTDIQDKKRRINALKWNLVTSFGYTGYKNAKYGKREAHETVTALGRRTLQRAKEIAEEHGFLFLHGLTDSLWLQKPGMQAREIQQLCQCIAEETGVPIGLEERHSYIAFLESTMKKNKPTATRYVARSTDGQMKYRGIALRRRDTPFLIKNFQKALLTELQSYGSQQAIQQDYSRFTAILNEYLVKVRERKFAIEDFIFRRHVSKSAKEYETNSVAKIILEILAEDKKELIGGERIEYIAVDIRSKSAHNRYVPFYKYKAIYGIDLEYYCQKLHKAFAEILSPFVESAPLLLS